MEECIKIQFGPLLSWNYFPGCFPSTNSILKIILKKGKKINENNGNKSNFFFVSSHYFFFTFWWTLRRFYKKKKGIIRNRKLLCLSERTKKNTKFLFKYLKELFNSWKYWKKRKQTGNHHRQWIFLTSNNVFLIFLYNCLYELFYFLLFL